MNDIKRYKEGMALLWVLLLCVVLLIVTGTMVDSVIKEMHMAINIEASAQAYSNAKTGTDWAIDAVKNQTPVPIGTTTFDFSANGGQGTATIIITPDGGTGNYPYTIESTGSWNGSDRKIETLLSQGSTGDDVTSGAFPKSYSTSFNLSFSLTKINAGPMSGTIPQLGVTDATNTNYLTFYYNTASTYFYLASNFGNIQVYKGDGTGAVSLSDLNLGTDSAVNVSINYLNSTNATLRITKTDGSCIGSAQLDLNGKTLGSINHLTGNSHYQSGGVPPAFVYPLRTSFDYPAYTDGFVYSNVSMDGH